MSFRSFDLYNLVNDFGQAVTLRKTTAAGTYDPATGSVSSQETTDYSVIGYFYEAKTGLVNDVPSITRGTSRCVISAQGITVEPEDGDQLVGVGDTVNVVAVKVIYSGPTKLCFICEVAE